MAETPARSTPMATTSVHLSAKMMEAQATFQRVVKQELQVLLASGLEREVAVRILLHRIVESTEEPEESDVKRVMRQFQMNYDDAVRALIVKQEIGRLKRQGLDAFAAIEELTRKMQQITVPSAAESEVEMTDDQDLTTTDVDNRISEAATDEQEEKANTDAAGDRDEASSRIRATTEDSAANQPMDGSQSTLCEQIDQFSISAVSQASSSSLSTTQPSESSRSAFTFFSATSRKRRVASGDSSPSYHGQTEPMEASQVRLPSFHRPLSPTFRFPKKQKLWTEEDEMNDAPVFDDEDDDDNTTDSTPLSPTGVSARDETPTPSNAPTPTKIGKRRRAIHGTPSPELDDIDVDDGPLVRVTKRPKL